MRKKLWVGMMVGLVLLLSSTVLVSADTSPYLIGVWEDDGETILTDFIVVNPTLATLDVYAAFFDNNGGFIQGKCFVKSLNPNAKWYMKGAALALHSFGSSGTAKFVGIEEGEKTHHKDLVIAGFQNRWMFQMSSSQANLNAVVLNKNTIAEIKEILKLECSPWSSD